MNNHSSLSSGASPSFSPLLNPTTTSPPRKQRASVQHDPRFRMYTSPPSPPSTKSPPYQPPNKELSPTNTSPHHFLPQWLKKLTTHHHHHPHSNAHSHHETSDHPSTPLPSPSHLCEKDSSEVQTSTRISSSSVHSHSYPPTPYYCPQHHQQMQFSALNSPTNLFPPSSPRPPYSPGVRSNYHHHHDSHAAATKSSSNNNNHHDHDHHHNSMFAFRANLTSHRNPASIIEMYHEEDLHPYPLTPTNIKHPPFDVLQFHHEKISSSLFRPSAPHEDENSLNALHDSHHHHGMEEIMMNSPTTSHPLSYPFNTNPDSPNQTLRRILTRFQHLFKSNNNNHSQQSHHSTSHSNKEQDGIGSQHLQGEVHAQHPHMKHLPKLEVHFPQNESQESQHPQQQQPPPYSHPQTHHEDRSALKPSTGADCGQVMHPEHDRQNVSSPKTPTSLVPSLLHPNLSPLSYHQPVPKSNQVSSQHPQPQEPSTQKAQGPTHQHDSHKHALLESLDTSQGVVAHSHQEDGANISLSEPTTVHHHQNLLSTMSPLSPRIHQPPHHHHVMDYFDSEPYPKPTEAQLHHPLHGLHKYRRPHHAHTRTSPHHHHHDDDPNKFNTLPNPNHEEAKGNILREKALVEESAKALQHPKKYSAYHPHHHHSEESPTIIIPTTDIIVCTQSSSLPTTETTQENTKATNSTAQKSEQQPTSSTTQTFFQRTSSENLAPVTVSWNIQQQGPSSIEKSNNKSTSQNNNMNIPKKTSQDDFYMEDSSLPESNVHSITHKPSRSTHIMSDEDGVIISSSPTSKPRVTTGQIQEEILDPIFDFFKTNTNYDLMPYSGKVIVFDIDLPVREAFQVAANNGMFHRNLFYLG